MTKIYSNAQTSFKKQYLNLKNCPAANQQNILERLLAILSCEFFTYIRLSGKKVKVLDNSLLRLSNKILLY